MPTPSPLLSLEKGEQGAPKAFPVQPVPYKLFPV